MATDDPLFSIDRFPVEPWRIREIGLDVHQLGHSESIFALSNGHIGLRGNLDEGDPHWLPGTYLNSFFESRPLPYAEAGYGYPESGQTIVNVTNGKVIRLLVDDEPLDVRYGDVTHHERVLDLRAGLLHRDTEWVSPAGQAVRVRSTRLVSLTQRSIVAIRYSVEPIDDPARVVIQSELVANEEMPRQAKDPRVAAILESPLEAQEHLGSGTRALLVHTTRSSQLRVAAAMDHVIDGPDGHRDELTVQPDWARLTTGKELQPGETLTITKFVAYGWSAQRTLPALRDQVDAALSAVLYTGWDKMLEEQRGMLDEYWRGADVELDGDPVVQQAVRFALFHTYQAAARAEQRAIPAKGLTGSGYNGHAFWDTETFVLPVLTASAPQAAADALRWRYRTLDLALDRAKTLYLKGAAFPWRTIRGQECSGYWPAGSAALHVNADIAAAVVRYVDWTGDEAFEREVALPLLVETARLWASVGYYGRDDRFHIDGVTGPDEYSALVDDNLYTNMMAALNLQRAADAATRCPHEASDLGVKSEEVEEWRRAAAAMSVPFETELGVHEQDRGFTRHEVWDFAHSAATDAYPLLLHAPYFDLYRKQVVKQADLILAMHLRGDAFTPEEKAKAVAYYEPLTVRDSSLSACTQAVLAAEVGHRELAYAYLSEAALVDLHNLKHNTGDGLHMASLAGAWIALVEGFGGLRDHRGELAFRPQLPPTISGLRFALRWRGARLHVDITPDTASYTLNDAAEDGMELRHNDEAFWLANGQTVTHPVHLVKPMTPRPTQPAGREPMYRTV
jgi:alpha,alpha-trehalose phosphorylase